MGFFDKLIKDIKTAAGVAETKPEQTAAPAPQTPTPAPAPQTPAPAPQTPAPAPQQEEPKFMEVAFGSRDPLPYNTDVCGTSAIIPIRFFGKALFNVTNAGKLTANGGAKAVEEKLRDDIIATEQEALKNCSEKGIIVSRITTQIPAMSEYISSKHRDEWSEKYGVTVDKLSIASIAMTQEGKEEYQRIMREQAYKPQ